MRGMRKQSLLMQSQEQARRERADNRRELIRFARHECARFGEHLYGDAAECCKDFFCWTLGNSSMKFGNQALEDVLSSMSWPGATSQKCLGCVFWLFSR